MKRPTRTSLTLAALSVLILASCSEEVPSTPESLNVVVSATPQAGTAPLTVHLSCGADNAEAPLTHSWLLGDGETSTEPNPTVVYKAGGSFAAVCQVVDARGLGGGGSVTITVDAAFAVAATADVIRGELPLAVSFSATPEGAGPFTFSWDFDGDDAEDSAEQDPSFTFRRSGLYSVKVTATDGSGATAQDVIEIDVLAPAPEVTATADNEVGEPPLEVNLSATATGEEPFTFSWDFDADGTEDSTAQSATFTYTESGVYTAVVTAADANGATAKDLLQIVVNSAPVAAPVADRCVRTGMPVTLDGSASTDLENDELVYEWTLLSAPDGSAVTELGLPEDPEPSPADAGFTPDLDGEYVVQLTVDDGWFSDTQTGTLTAADDVRVQTSDDSVRVGLTRTDIDPLLAVQVVNVCAEDPLYEAALAEVAVEWTGDNATPGTYASVTDADGWAVYDGGEYGEPGDGDVSAEALEQWLRFDLEIECGLNRHCETTTGGVCDGGECEQASCSDGLLNQDEANVDCGGHACGPTCANGQGCYPYFDGECASFNCSADGECVGLCDTEGWNAPVSLDFGAVGDSLATNQAPVVATDGGSTWLMLWLSNRTGARDIVYTRSTDNRRSWSEVADLSAYGYGYYEERNAPQLATDQAGGWIVVWESGNNNVGGTSINGDYDILYATSPDNGESWSDTQILASNASELHPLDRVDRAPSIAADGLGNWLVVWQSSSFVETGPDNEANLFFDLDILYAFSEDDGVSWTDPRPVDKVGARDDNSWPPWDYASVYIDDELPTVAADDSGVWATAWSHGPSRDYFVAGWDLDVLVSTTDDPAEGWSAPVRLSPDHVGGQPRWSVDPSIATDGSQWALVWSTNTSSLFVPCDASYAYDIMVAPGEVDGDSIVWGDATSVEQFCGYSERPRPQIATDSAGTWVVTWTRGEQDIYYAVSEDFGENWSDADLLYDGAGFNGTPTLAANESGRWMVAWDSADTSFAFFDQPDQLVDIGDDWDIVTSFLCENDFLTPE